MARFIPLFSGSSGNSVYIEQDGEGILIDAGVSCARLTRALCENGVSPDRIRAVFVTHSHGDHIGGLRVFVKKYGTAVFCTPDTANGINEYYNGNAPECRLDDSVQLSCMSVERFDTPHDCVGSCGYIINLGEQSAAVCTDLGSVTDTVHNALSGCRTVMLESNHDVAMLQKNPNYPMALKQRIMGGNGHLSNNGCAAELARLVREGGTNFVLAHLSRENNMPRIAHDTSLKLLEYEGMREGLDYSLTVAMPEDNSVVYL